MEAKNAIMENNAIPQFLKNNKLKIGGEENNPIVVNNNIKDESNKEQNTKEKMQFLFPNLPPEEINKVLERTEYNIEKAISLIKELKQQKKLNTLENPIKNENSKKRRKFRGIYKRNYISCIQKKRTVYQNNTDNASTQRLPANPQNNLNTINNNNTNINNTINTINSNNEIRNIPNANANSNTNINTINNNNINSINIISNSNNNNANIHENNISANNAGSVNTINNNERNNETNSNNKSLDERRTNLIKRQIDFLVKEFSKMNDISQLKKLLTEIGFPVTKDEKKIENLEEILQEKIKSNQEEKQFIVNQYKKHNAICQRIKEKEEKIDELTCSLANLIEAESDQKIREEKYRNELMAYARNKNNNFYNPTEDY
jgi:hypothetical protein